MEKPDAHKFQGNDRFEGYCAELAEKVAKILKFDYEIIPVPDGQYGKLLDNGTWTGMIGELVSNVRNTFLI